MRTIITLCLLAFSFYGSAQCPPNIDFEAGDFSHWDCFIGYTDTIPGQNVITMTPSPPTPGRHEIISTSTSDPYGNFPTLCPYGGNYSIKLGNNSTGSEAEGISYTFQIPPLADTFSLTYYYAVVFEDPGHFPIEQPRFFVTAYDVVTGQLINCASYNYVSTASIPGFQVSPVDNTVWYKDWTPSSIDFSGFAGRTVRLEFKTADCTRGGHFGYAYVDVGTGCGGVIAAAALCGATNSVILNAPYGFQTYTWYNSNYTVVVGSQQAVTLIPPPPANTLFHVDMIPYPGYGCRDTADAMVTALPVPDTPVAVTNYEYCQGQQASQLTATATNPNELLWYTSTTSLSSTVAPIPSTAVAGTFYYYVTQKKLFGCESPRTRITVHVSLTPITTFNINNDHQCQNTNNFLFTSGTTNTVSNSEYTWDFGDNSTSTLTNPTHVYSNYGSYTVKLKVVNPPTCFKEIIKPVYVIAKPVAQFSYPFTVCENQTSITLVDNSTVPGGFGLINNWNWNIGSSTVTSQNPPPFLAAGGPLPIKFVVRTTEGCSSDTNYFSLPVHYRPIVKFKNSEPLCNNETILFNDISTLPSIASPDYINTWSWSFDNAINTTLNSYSLNLNPGLHHVKFISETNIGCRGIALDSNFMVYEKPHIKISINDSCINRSIQYSGISTGTNAAIKWYWDFGNGFHQGNQVTNKWFTAEGYNPLTLIGQSAEGCKDTIIRPFTIYQNHAVAGHDTIAAKGQPVQLNAGGGSTVNYTWSPSTGLNNAHIENPIAVLDEDQLYELNSMSMYGCDARSKILIRRYKGPELFIPNAFTPNDDGLNDKLKVFPVGIKYFYSFAVYNRFGVCLFYTTDYYQGWDGTYKGVKSDPGNFVAIAKALDYRGNVMTKKTNVLLLR